MRAIAGQGLLVTILSVQGDSTRPDEMYAIVETSSADRRFETSRGAVRANQRFIATMRTQANPAFPKSDFNHSVKEMRLEGLVQTGHVVSLDGVEITNDDELEFSSFERLLELAA